MIKGFCSSALLLVSFTATTAAATTIVRDISVNLDGYPVGRDDTWLYADYISVAPISSLSVGDTIKGTVTFSRGKIVTLANTKSDETLSFIMMFDGDYRYTGSGRLTLRDEAGLTDKTFNTTNMSGGGLGIYATGNLTDAGVTFSGFDYSIDITKIMDASYTKSVNTANGFSTYARFVTSAAHTSLVAAVPEPATWAMMIAGFGVVGGAMRRRKRAASTGFA